MGDFNFEALGKKLDKATDKLGKDLKNAAENVKASDFGQKVNEATDNLGQNLKSAASTAKNANLSNKLKYTQLTIIVASVVMIISTFLPQYRLEMGVGLPDVTVNMIYAFKHLGDGIFFIVLGGLLIAFAYLKRRKPLLIVTIITALLFLIHCVKGVDLSNSVNQFSSVLFDIRDYLHLGFGYYLFMLSAIVAVGAGVFYYILTKPRSARKLS